VELAVVVIVGFKDGKISHEHIYWDQASVLVQVGLLNPASLPVTGAESARKVLDPNGQRAAYNRCFFRLSRYLLNFPIESRQPGVTSPKAEAKAVSSCSPRRRTEKRRLARKQRGTKPRLIAKY
jgi:hypothetical protein